jgi:polyisoprenoid-binding protein YceI
MNDMKKITTLTGAMGLLAGMVLPVQGGNYELNIHESTLTWIGKKVGGKHYGNIQFEKGNFEVVNNQIRQGNFEVNMHSIVCTDIENETWNKKLVDHLKSEDFFSTEKHPVSTLVLMDSRHIDGGKYRFDSELTIKGITHPLTFEADIEVKEEAVSVSGVLRIDRTRYSMKYGSGKFFKSLGDNMIDDYFTLNFAFVAVHSGEVVSTKRYD